MGKLVLEEAKEAMAQAICDEDYAEAVRQTKHLLWWIAECGKPMVGDLPRIIRIRGFISLARQAAQEIEDGFFNEQQRKGLFPRIPPP